MLALSLKKNKKFSYVSLNLPKIVDKNKCRIKIFYSAICSSDIPRAYFNQSYFYPLILGHEFSGKIVQCGKNVNNYKIGQRVSVFPLIPKCNKCESCRKKKFNLCKNYSYYGSREDGSFCEYIDVYDWNLYKINNKLNLRIASLLEPTAVAFNVYEKIIVKKKLNILIIGAGFISQVLIRILNLSNNFIITVADRNNFKLKLANNYILNKINFDLSKKNNIKKFKLLNNKFDCIIDSTGNARALNFGMNTLAPNGQFIAFGNVYKDTILKKKNYSFILRKELSVKGVWNSTYKKNNNNWKQAENFLLRNSSKILPLISHSVSLKKAKNLLDRIYLNKLKKIKFNYLKGIIKIA